MNTDPASRSYHTRLVVALLGASLLAPASLAQFTPTSAGTYDYNNTANWNGGTINGIFSNEPAGSQMLTFASPTTLASGLTFSFTGSSKLITLQGVGNQTLTLGGDINVSSTGSSSLITFGALSSNKLDIDLGGANRSFSVSSGNVLKILNTISGSNSITTVGPGTTIFAGDNTYTGGTTITSGTLVIGDGGSTGSILGNVANNGTLTFGRTGTLTYSGIISGTGALSKASAGTVTLTGANTYGGLTSITGGTLQLGANDVLPASTQVSTSSGATFDLNSFNQTVGSLSNAGSITLGTGTLTVNNAAFSSTTAVISGTGSLIKTGAGILALVGDNTYTGTTTISAGSLWIGNASTTGSIAGDIVNNAALAFNRTNNLAYGGVISGTGSVTKYEGGTLTLNGQSTYTGATTVNGGTLLLNTSGALNAGNNVTVTSNVGGTTVTLELASSVLQTIGSLTLGGQNSTSTANVTLDSGSKLTLGGTVAYGASNNPAQANINGPGTLDLGANRTFNIGNSSTTTSDLAISAPISGTGFSLTKTGAGTLQLSGANVYTGGTTVAAGGLFVTNTTGSGVGTGGLTIQAGATLRGSGIIGGATTILASGIMGTGGTGGTPATLTFTNGLTLNNGAVFNFQLGTSSDLFALTGGTLTGAATLGTLTINLTAGSGFAAGNYTLFDFTSAAGTSSFTADDFVIGTQISGYTASVAIVGSTLQLTASAIPEPSTYAAILAAASLVGAAIYRRRRARVRA